ncbi:MAG: 3'-phosphoesterase [Candidatus Doudnabacteria bacterium]|nr:3'-phosphoesterase [Candidatus Doudnabacteria bacterium]
MSLAKYKQKRKFDKTPEPVGGKSKAKFSIFVVQKHDASRLHYDFRLEAGGVLKSWAVPKGPSMKTEDKRLAMMVEDHPYDYKDFEGMIPKGNYGAGTVMVWDFGNYLAPGAKSKIESEKMVKAGLRKGEIKLVLNGKKLRGGFVLVHTKGQADNAWLLIKEKDEFVSKADATKQDKSAKTKRSLGQIAKAEDKIWHSNRKK